MSKTSKASVLLGLIAGASVFVTVNTAAGSDRSVTIQPGREFFADSYVYVKCVASVPHTLALYSMGQARGHHRSHKDRGRQLPLIAVGRGAFLVSVSWSACSR